MSLVVSLFFEFFTACLVAAFSVSSFFVYFMKEGKTDMFGKKNTDKEASNLTIASASSAVSILNNNETDSSCQNTIIARDVCVEGNIRSTGLLYIYGEFKGDINAANGQIHVMRSGKVTGNITAPVLIVDGLVVGECDAEKVDICRHGNVQGVIQYSTLSVATGGIFSGRAEQRCDMQAQDTNVVDFTPEPDPRELHSANEH
ncbi:MAG TPA: polymer-forming cytoskeletal protein [Scandinavium sp.]